MAGAVAVLTIPLAAAAATVPLAETHVTKALAPIGQSANLVPIDNNVDGDGVFNSDLAFSGTKVIQGTYDGFRIIDVANPASPVEVVDWKACGPPDTTTGNQGDVIVFGNLIFRSYNSGAPAPLDPLDTTPPISSIPTSDPRRYTIPGAFCGNWPMFREPATPAGCTPSSACTLPERGQEGVHVIDVSNPASPQVVAFVDTPCGSHTATGIPDLANNRFLIYSSSSANTVFGQPTPAEEPISCRGLDLIEVPLNNPSAARYVAQLPSGDPMMPRDTHHSCHDTGAITGEHLMLACAGGDSLAMWTMDPAKGGSFESPKFMHHTDFGPGFDPRLPTAGVSVGHSAAFTPDGKYVVFGSEPGGGSQAQCQATSNVVNKSIYFVESETGEIKGHYTQVRPQTNVENCTWHNYNVVPDDDGYFLVTGNYQQGIGVVDFTDIANPREIAFADPAPLVDPNPPVGIELGGDWSTYWYNGLIYESDITRGLIVWGRQTNDQFRQVQVDQRDAFNDKRAADLAAFNAAQAAAKAAKQAEFDARAAQCAAIPDRVQRAACQGQLRADQTAFRLQQAAELAAFKAQQQQQRVAFEAVQAQDKLDFQRVPTALQGPTLAYLNPQSVEHTFE
jgi:hypothetical protein